MMRVALPHAPAFASPLMCAALALPAFAQEEPADEARALEQRTQEIKEASSPAIVSVTVTPRTYDLPRLAFPGFSIAPNPQQPQRIEGTGFFVASRGLLVTTRALVADAKHIEVRFCDGTTRDASLLGVDGPFRLAVLRTSAPAAATELPHSQRVEARFGTIGWFMGAQPASECGSAVDVQVASVRPAPERGATYDRFLYAPMSISRGAAGGPLVGCDGRLMGMAVGSLVARDTTGAGSRLPHATLFVRGDDVAEAARQIAERGFVERPMIGAMMESDTNRIDALLPGSPAEESGLAEGDAIVAVGQVAIASFADLTRVLLRKRAGDPVRLTVDRGGERFIRSVTLAPYKTPSLPKEPPFPGAVVELSAGELGEWIFTFVEVETGSRLAKAGVEKGDRLVAVDSRPAWRFLQRHRARPQVPSPATIQIERAGQLREIALP